jgi:hypothetical protein
MALAATSRGTGPALRVVYSAFTGIFAESALIDSDHRRHLFLLLGVLWG